MPALLAIVSVLTCLVSGWMTVMYLLLRHPNYAEHAVMGGAICAGAAVIALGGWRGPATVRATLAVWAVALAGLGMWALVGERGDDGWVVIAGMLFLVEGVLALAGLVRANASTGTA